MEFDLEKSIEILERTPYILYALLMGISEEWIYQNEGENTWCPYDVIGHLNHGENTDWVVRTKIILDPDADKNFTQFDRFAQFENSKNKTIQDLLGEFIELRKVNIQKLKALNISNEQLAMKGIHPEFGPITLRQLLAAWVVHDLGHINQVSRVMAKQYKDESGPWIKYLKVLSA